MFKTTSTFGKFGRSGYFETRAGRVITPVFMPVGTRGAVKSVSPEQLRSVGTEIVLANTYHLHLQPGGTVVKKLGGLHQFMRWPGPILTDSGGFQVFSLAHVRKITEEGVEFRDPKTGDKVFISPEISMQIQIELGADVIMAFDDLTGLDEHDRGRTSEAYERTHRWLERSIAEFKKLTQGMDKRPLLFGISQGGLNEDLRLKSLKFVQETDVDGIAVGGLSVGESKTDMYKILELLAPHYDPDRPRYLMGVGDPPDLRFAYEHGVDMADCVIPTRNARHGSVWVSGDVKLSLKSAVHEQITDTIEPGCQCYSCKEGFSRGWLRHQFKSAEPLAGTLASLHNIYYLQQIAKNYR